MKKFELIFAVILVPLDYLALLLAGTLAYFLRFQSFVTEIRPVIFELKFSEFLQILTVVSLAWLIVFAYNGLYSLKRKSFLNTLSKIFTSSSVATLIIVAAFFFNFQLFSSRLIILTGWLLSILLVSLERALVYFSKKIFYKKGFGVRQVVIFGDNKNAQEIIDEYREHPSYGFRLIKHYQELNQSVLAELVQLVKVGQIDDIILTETGMDAGQKNDLVNFCVANRLDYKYVASLLETKLINFSLSTVGGVPLIEVKQTRLDGWGRIIKRLFDFLLGLILFILFLPLMLLVYLIVVLTSTGPGIVKLTRIGSGGKKFKIYKFRSMVKNADKLKPELAGFNQRADGPLFKMDHDPRVTGFGRFIRKWSLDELPQLLNVILGNMSLVGPRPHEPEEVAKYQTREKKLLVIKPGLTGLAQVSGRSDLAWEEEVRLDTYYVENWSLGLDLQIILKTPRAVFGKRRTI